MSNFQHGLWGKGLNWVHTVDTEHQPFQFYPPTCSVPQGNLKHQTQVLASGLWIPASFDQWEGQGRGWRSWIQPIGQHRSKDRGGRSWTQPIEHQGSKNRGGRSWVRPIGQQDFKGRGGRSWVSLPAGLTWWGNLTKGYWQDTFSRWHFLPNKVTLPSPGVGWLLISLGIKYNPLLFSLNLCILSSTSSNPQTGVCSLLLLAPQG